QQSFTDYLLSKDLKQCKYKNVFLIQMYMGLRCGETLALTTHDIDLKQKKMNIHRTLTTDENNAIIMGNKTKTYAGKRVIPIPDFIYTHIIEQMQIAENQENNEENNIENER
ncbi:MAG: tyrosine-type recombinase/integrase, partial [Clostridia bacterium]|nr:tyrosine-type recombinase/integrase [Clostridia bacterium]